MSDLQAAVRTLPPISLADLNATAELMNRIDRKYFVPPDVLAELIPRLGSDLHALEIDDVRAFEYETVYFDSASFDLFRQHAQQRRHRFKVRTRLYRDSGDCRLEVKSQGLRGRTVKQRRPHDPAHRHELDVTALGFVSPIIRADAASLHRVLETVYRRTTLSDGERRITLDVDLEWIGAGRRIAGPVDVLIETKSPAGAGRLDRMLMRRGIRPHSVSKYCLAVSLLYPHLHGNDWSRIRRRHWDASPMRLS